MGIQNKAKFTKSITIVVLALLVLIGVTIAVILASKNATKPTNAGVSTVEKFNPKPTIRAELTTVPTPPPKVPLVKYEGKLYHIFFHSLILYPELAFDNVGHPKNGYNMWMTTKDECAKILDKLYENDFILYNIENYITRNSDGTVTKKDVMLPQGKKPLVISIDDVNYYDYMQKDGFATRLVVDKNGDVVTEVKTPKGEIITTRDGDVMPMVDEFVKKHPDFSFEGAKGIMAVTGYEGALGYRITDLQGDELAKAQDTVKQIANKMRGNGWKFACHSYTHNSYFQTGKITMEQTKYDTDRWKKDIEPYIGATKIYISPFGVHFKNDDPRYRYIINSGFDIYCGVGGGMDTKFYSDNMNQDRFNLDGWRMLKAPSTVAKDFFDIKDIVDKSRPPIE